MEDVPEGLVAHVSGILVLRSGRDGGGESRGGDRRQARREGQGDRSHGLDGVDEHLDGDVLLAVWV